MSLPRPTPPPAASPATQPDLGDLGPLPVGSLGAGFPGSEHGLGFILGLCLGSSPLGPLGTACFAPASCPIPLLGPPLHLWVRSAGRVRPPQARGYPGGQHPRVAPAPVKARAMAPPGGQPWKCRCPIQGREGLAPGAGAQGAGQGPVLRPPTRGALHPPPPGAPCHTRCCGPGILAPRPRLLHCFAPRGRSPSPKSQPGPPRTLSSQPAPRLSWSPRRPPSRRLCGRWPAPQRCRWTPPWCGGAGSSGLWSPPGTGGEREASAGPRTPSGSRLRGHGPHRPGCW